MTDYLSRLKPRKLRTARDLIDLQEKGKRKGIVFLLGAGASAEAGIPVSAEMLNRLRSARHPHAALLAELEKFRRFSDIEDLLLTLHALARPDDSELSPFVKGWRIPVKDADYRSSVMQLHDYVRRRLYGWLKPRRDCSYLAKLYQFGSSGRPSSNRRHSVDVFSLNYDLAVEKACESLSIPIRTGYESEGDPFNDPVLDFDKWDFDNAGVCLYKLHGSLNWGVPKTRKLETPDFSTVLAVQRSIFDYRPFSFVNYRRLPRGRHGFHLDAFSGPMKGMIFGTKDKAMFYPPFITLQEAFNEALRRASALVVLGYGWHDPDINLRIERASEGRLLVVDVVRDVAKAGSEPQRHAHVIVGSGVKSVLNDAHVTVVVPGTDGPVQGTADGGIAGALKTLPTLYRQNRRSFCGPRDDFDFDQYINVTEESLNQLLRESYTKGVVRTVDLGGAR